MSVTVLGVTARELAAAVKAQRVRGLKESDPFFFKLYTSSVTAEEERQAELHLEALARIRTYRTGGDQ